MPFTDKTLLLGYTLFDNKLNKIWNPNSDPSSLWLTSKPPHYLEDILANPGVLLVQENILMDDISLDNELRNYIDAGHPNARKVGYILHQAPNVELVRFNDLLATPQYLDLIADHYKVFKEMDFSDLVEPINIKYRADMEGFEKINASVMMAFADVNPNNSIVDDLSRSGLYNELALNFPTDKKEISLKELQDAFKSSILPVPIFEQDWDPVQFLKLYDAPETKRLRKIVSTLSSGESSETALDLIQEAIDLSKISSSSKKTFLMLGDVLSKSLSAALLSSVFNPLFTIPAYFSAYKSSSEFVDHIDDIIAKGKTRWLDVIIELEKTRYSA